MSTHQEKQLEKPVERPLHQEKLVEKPVERPLQQSLPSEPFLGETGGRCISYFNVL
jgi:hypothetical protein